MPVRSHRNDLDNDKTRTYSISELNQQTARVLEAINSSGSPALITRHGRFVAMITPLENFPTESLLIRELLQDLESRSPAEATDALLTGSELADELDFNKPRVKRRHD